MLKLMYDALLKNGVVYVHTDKVEKFKVYCRNRKRLFSYKTVYVAGFNLVKFYDLGRSDVNGK